MKILLIGSGGREHALAWKLSQSPSLTQLICAPGNPGIAELCECVGVKADDVAGLVALAVARDIDLVVVGPEIALEAGIADALFEKGVACFGPSRAAAQLETSKAFAKAFLNRWSIPTAAYGVFEDAKAAEAFLQTLSPPYVIKADGLAAGKGVVIAPTLTEAVAAVEDMLGGRFGAAGAQVVIEEFMAGEEASLFALCDGERAVILGGAQDHKRAFDGDQGPNTGGMGTYAPAPVITPEVAQQAQALIFDRALHGMKSEGAPYVGVLYAGLMIGPDGQVRLVEFNARFGDPECQVLMLRFDGDLARQFLAAASGRLDLAPPFGERDQAAVCVVMAAKGYPDAPQTGGELKGVAGPFPDGVQLFYAGIAKTADDQLVASGGRVLNVCAVADDFPAARAKAYAAVEAIDFPSGFYRRDIGWRAIDRD